MSELIKLLMIILLTSNTLGLLESPSSSTIVLDENKTTEFCTKKKCIRKCCAKNEYMNSNYVRCESYKTNKTKFFDLSSIPVYDDNNLDTVVSKTVSEIFYLIEGPYKEVLEDIDIIPSEEPHLTKNGLFYDEFKNSYQRWYRAEKFCLDNSVDENGDTTPVFWFIPAKTNTSETTNGYYTAALILSSIFLLIVLVVYILLPELRNLAGLILMAYVLSLMGAFLSLASLQLTTHNAEECIGLTSTTYFFFLATFCWMNVMSYDIWWTFRGYAKARPIHRRGEKFKFGMYCIYAWGLPLAMTVMLIIMNQIDLEDKPWIIKPLIVLAGCFLQGGQKFVYLYVPMLILIICNWLFFLMTVFNILRLSRGTSAVNSDAAGNATAHRNQKQRLLIYLKLSVIMGINWVLEVTSFFSPDLQVWNITDAYNLLMGLAIFLIFVFKKKIYRKLRQRYLHKRVGITRHGNSSSTNASETNTNEVSQETSLQINMHPMGKPVKNSK